MLTLKPDQVEKADAWFDARGGKAVLFERLVPTVRTLISVRGAS
jgi:membrane protein DedA with SNARE-associated domain